MKKLISTLVISLFAIQLVLAIKPKPIENFNSKTEEFEKKFDQLKKEAVNHYSIDRFHELSGRKPKFHERIALKYFQNKVKRDFNQIEKQIERYKSNKCDVMILNNGEEVEVKIVEITSNVVKYKKCDYLDDPLYTKEKEAIFMIIHSNGTKEMISSNSVPVSDNNLPPSPYEQEVNTSWAWIAGFFSGLLLLALGMLVSLAFPKGVKRKTFWVGWGIGFGLYLLAILFIILSF